MFADEIQKSLATGIQVQSPTLTLHQMWNSLCGQSKKVNAGHTMDDIMCTFFYLLGVVHCHLTLPNFSLNDPPHVWGGGEPQLQPPGVLGNLFLAQGPSLWLVQMLAQIE